MKKLAIVFALVAAFGSAASAQDDAISKYFNQYMDDERFTMVFISPRMFELFSKIEVEDMDKELQEVIGNLKGLRILTTEQNGLTFYKEAKKMINTKEYEVLMTVRDEAENVEFLIKETGNTINELLLLVGGTDSEFVLMSFVGDIDIDKIARLARSLDVEGLEHLEKIRDAPKTPAPPQAPNAPKPKNEDH